ncbi:MAG: ribonuclease HII [Bdellovibrionales bacterium]
MKKTMEHSMYDWQQHLVDGPVVGVDEVGRGCLAGRVYACAAELNLDADWEMYTDSKVLSEKKREAYAKHIVDNHRYSIAYASVEEIHKYNILNASLLAMHRAVMGLKLDSATVLIDGNKTIPNLDVAYQQITLVKGDLRAQPIAAAAIVAKVQRDRYIAKLGEKYPGYGFELHKAYATKAHKAAIEELGPTEEHRRDFKGVKEHWAQLQL